MKQQIVYGAVVFGTAVAIGLLAGRSSWNGAIYLTKTSFTSHNRLPASDHRDLEEVKLDAGFLTASRGRMISEAKVLFAKEQKGQMGLELGHFLAPDSEGNQTLACESYRQMRLTFEAEGVATAGDKPTMEIEAPCHVGQDITKMEPVWIPVMSILSEKATDMDLTFAEAEGMHFKFSYMTGEWPRRWVLSQATMLNNSATGSSLSFNAREIRALRQKPLVLSWPAVARLPSTEK